MFKTVRLVLKWFALVLLTLGIGIAAGLYIYKDRIVSQVVAEVNKNLSVPIAVSKVDLELFHGFPNVSVVFLELQIPGNSTSNSNRPLLKTKKLYALVNSLDLINGDFSIDRFEIEDGEVHILVDKENRNNLSEIFNNQHKSEGDEVEVKNSAFNLKDFLLTNIEIYYVNHYTGSKQQWHIKQLRGNLNHDNTLLSSRVKGNIEAIELLAREWQLKKGKRDFEVDIAVDYNDSTKSLIINNASVTTGGASFLIMGGFMLTKTPTVDMSIKGEHVTIGLLASNLPPYYRAILAKYKSSGSIRFDANFKGAFLPDKSPSLMAELELNNVDLIEEAYNANINDLFVAAKLDVRDIGDISTGKLTINSARGFLEDKPFVFDLSLNNLVHPKYSGHIKGSVGAKWLMAGLKMPNYAITKGDINVELKAVGAFNNRGVLEKSDISGSLRLKNVSLPWGDSLIINKINGSILFDGDEVSISNTEINWLDSDVHINGTIQDFMSGFTSTQSKVPLLKANIVSNNLAVEDILGILNNRPKLPTDTALVNNVKLDMQLACLVDQLKFDRYHGTNISGELVLQDNVLEVTDLRGTGMGGREKIDGKIDFTGDHDIYLEAQFLTNGVNLDSMFYVFHNFAQDFITDKALKGKLYAAVNTSMYFDKKWYLKRPLLKAKAKIRVVEGELNDFAPIMALSEYIDDREDNLSRLKFSDLMNYITVNNDTVFIPEMSIKTNVRNIALGGYHTLDQHINYQLVVPIINERVDKDEAFGAIQKSSSGSPNLLFKIKGTTTDYKVNYDLMRAAGRVLKLLDITQIFKKKEKELKDSTFLNEEDFDWEN